MSLVTGILVALNALYFIFLEMIGGSENVNILREYGGMFAPDILEKGEYYRLLTAVFMHSGIDHIVYNMLMLCVFGRYVQRSLGTVRYVIIFLFSGVGANVLDFVLKYGEVYPAVGVGASGAVYGLAGSMLAIAWLQDGRIENLNLTQIVAMLAISLYLGYTAVGVNNMAHVSGAILGFLLTVILYKTKKYRNRNRREPYGNR